MALTIKILYCFTWIFKIQRRDTYLPFIWTPKEGCKEVRKVRCDLGQICTITDKNKDFLSHFRGEPSPSPSLIVTLNSTDI